jgi:hypothetical protein
MKDQQLYYIVHFLFIKTESVFRLFTFCDKLLTKGKAGLHFTFMWGDRGDGA